MPVGKFVAARFPCDKLSDIFNLQRKWFSQTQIRRQWIRKLKYNFQKPGLKMEMEFRGSGNPTPPPRIPRSTLPPLSDVAVERYATSLGVHTFLLIHLV